MSIKRMLSANRWMFAHFFACLFSSKQPLKFWMQASMYHSRHCLTVPSSFIKLSETESTLLQLVKQDPQVYQYWQTMHLMMVIHKQEQTCLSLMFINLCGDHSNEQHWSAGPSAQARWYEVFTLFMCSVLFLPVQSLLTCFKSSLTRFADLVSN